MRIILLLTVATSSFTAVLAASEMMSARMFVHVRPAMWCTSNSKGHDSFDSSDGPDDGILWLGNDRRFTTSKNFEAFREGLEDVAYLDRLRKELKRHSALGNAYPEYEKLDAKFMEQCKKPDQREIEAWRLATGRAINELVKNLQKEGKKK